MTHEQFNQLQEEMLNEVRQMVVTKGIEYANSDTDRLANFKRAAERRGLEPEDVLMVYCDKHLDAINSYIRTTQEFSNEGIRGRIIDVITYMTLLWGLIKERKDLFEKEMAESDKIPMPEVELIKIEPDEMTKTTLETVEPISGGEFLQEPLIYKKQKKSIAERHKDIPLESCVQPRVEDDNIPF